MRSNYAKSLLIVSGTVGGFVGGVASAPLFGRAYIGTLYVGLVNRSCVYGLAYCWRFYWVLFCTSFAGAVLGACIGFFLQRTCDQQLGKYPGVEIMRFQPRLLRFTACVKGGVLAAAIAGPVVGIGSAAFGGPVIPVSDIYDETTYTVLIISLSIIGAFRSWNVKLLTDYIEGVLLLAIVLKLPDLTAVIPIDMYTKGMTGGYGVVETITYGRDKIYAEFTDVGG